MSESIPGVDEYTALAIFVAGMIFQAAIIVRQPALIGGVIFIAIALVSERNERKTSAR